MRPKDLRSSSCVCSQWNVIISSCKKLNYRRNALDYYEEIKFAYKFDRLCDPFGICAGQDGNSILVSDHTEEAILVFDLNGRYDYSIGKGICRDPMGICIKESKIFICSWNDSAIQIFDAYTRKLLSSISTKGYTPYWVCKFKGGHIVVATVEHIIIVFDSNGSVVNQFDTSQSGPDNGIGIDCNNQEEIIVSNFVNSTMQIFSQYGKLLRTFGNENNGSDHSFGRSCIYVDEEENNILVSDGENNSISIFTRDGTFIQQVKTGTRIYGICLVGRKLSATTDDSIYVFSN